MDKQEKGHYLVVGGSSGIGKSVISQLLAHGHTVTNWSRRNTDFTHPRLHSVSVDVTGDITEAASTLPEKLHGVVYAPGSIILKPFHRLTTSDFEQDFRLNVSGAVVCIQAALKALKNSGNASIVLYSTVAVQTGMGFHASVASAKGALEGLGRSLAAELAPQHIRVNVLAPSLTDTPLAGALLNTPEKREAAAKRHPLGVIGTAEDLASATVFLLSPASGWITGQVIGVDGGMGRLK
jgi:NAD(P)-dependent dehydrogenase (short-subunit alcohol dehydrogenase family)